MVSLKLDVLFLFRRFSDNFHHCVINKQPKKERKQLTEAIEPQSSFASWKTGIFALLLLLLLLLVQQQCSIVNWNMRNQATMFNGDESRNPAIPDAAVGQKLFCTILPLAICHGGCGACFFFHYTLSEVKSAFFVQQAELLPSAINHWSVGRLLQPAVALRRASLKRATPPLWALWFDKCLVC
ncbi:hypothetical protein T08_3015 [Trichinella sp. T8]|nr:hypothetical protein T08_3015 [Trichinella sp. T8]